MPLSVKVCLKCVLFVCYGLLSGRTVYILENIFFNLRIQIVHKKPILFKKTKDTDSKLIRVFVQHVHHKSNNLGTRHIGISRANSFCMQHTIQNCYILNPINSYIH